MNTVKIVVLLFIFVSICSASTAIIIVDRDRIFIGADSKVVWSNRNAPPLTLCKIDVQFENCSFVIVGMGFNHTTGFDPAIYARHACEAKHSLAETVQRFAEETKTPLANALTYDRMFDAHAEYSRYKFDANSPVVPPLSAAFVGFENGTPLEVGVDFVLDENEALKPIFTSSVEDGKIVTLGYQFAALRIINDAISNPQVFAYHDRSELLHTAIKAEIARGSRTPLVRQFRYWRSLRKRSFGMTRELAYFRFASSVEASVSVFCP